MEEILDNFCSSGETIDSFKKELKELDNRTFKILASAEDIVLLSKESVDSDVLNIFMLDPKNLWQRGKGQASLKAAKISKKDLKAYGAEKLIKEYEDETGLLVRYDGKIFFTSKRLSSTLGLRAQAAGEAIAKPSLARDVLLAHQLNNTSEMTLIVRKDGPIRKIFAALSDKYAYEPQSLLSDIIDKISKHKSLGKPDCHHWTVNNQISEIFIEFPEMAEEISAIYDMPETLIPGVFLAKSDVGQCSITARATWRIGSSIIALDEVRQRHSGNIEIEKLIKDIDTAVFSKYTKLPEKLCELMEISITKPSWKKKMTQAEFENHNKSVVSDIIKSIFKQIGLVEATTKKIEKEIFNALCDELDPSLSYTAYDIALMIMQLPGREILNLPKAYVQPLAKACGKAPYAKYEPIKPAKKIILAS